MGEGKGVDAVAEESKEGGRCQDLHGVRDTRKGRSWQCWYGGEGRCLARWGRPWEGRHQRDAVDAEEEEEGKRWRRRRH